MLVKWGLAKADEMGVDVRLLVQLRQNDAQLINLGCC